MWLAKPHVTGWPFHAATPETRLNRGSLSRQIGRAYFAPRAKRLAGNHHLRGVAVPIRSNSASNTDQSSKRDNGVEETFRLDGLRQFSGVNKCRA